MPIAAAAAGFGPGFGFETGFVFGPGFGFETGFGFVVARPDST
jgi:hypothetical protein